MYDQSYAQTTVAARATRSTVLGQVLGLLGFSFVCTAAGAWLGTALGPGAFIPALVVSLGALIALYVVRERAPFNLGLLYLFATAVAVTLGLVLQSFLIDIMRTGLRSSRGAGDTAIDTPA